MNLRVGTVVESLTDNAWGGVKMGDRGVIREVHSVTYSVYWGLREGHHSQAAHVTTGGWLDMDLAPVPALVILAEQTLDNPPALLELP